MPRYYYRPSLLGLFFRWAAGVSLLVLFLVALEWLLTDFLPAVLPFVLAGVVVAAAAVWLARRLR